MNKYELKYMLEQMSSSVDRLTDVAGKQQHHISELWEEIGHKNTKIQKLKEKIPSKETIQGSLMVAAMAIIASLFFLLLDQILKFFLEIILKVSF